MDDLFIAGNDCRIVARGRSDPTQNHLAVREQDQIRLAIKPWIIRRCPGCWNKLFSPTELASCFTGSFADAASDFGAAATDLACAGIYRCAILIDDDLADMMLAPGLITPFAALVGELLPQLAGVMSRHVHVNPGAARQLEARSRTIHLSFDATRSAARHRSLALAREADLLVRPRAALGGCGCCIGSRGGLLFLGLFPATGP